MGAINSLVRDVSLPQMLKVKQHFDSKKIEDIPAELKKQLLYDGIGDTIKSGARIAITAGSRGINNIDIITKQVVDFCKTMGAKPFVVASMGSHGGATKEGQLEVLEGYGITEDSMGCPIMADMDIVQICTLDTGESIMIDKNAAEADGIILINRVKAHTAFRGEYESGLIKMMAIGLGKQSGAEGCHGHGALEMADSVKRYGVAIHKHAKILFGLAIIENAHEDTAIIKSLRYDEIVPKEPALLEIAKELMPRFYIPQVDLLIVDEIGKNISGDGMDPNITGRSTVRSMEFDFSAKMVLVLDLTEQSHNNGNGIGLADIITMRAFKKFDREKSYPNVLTSKAVINCTIPMMFDTDKQAIQAALMMSTGIDKNNPRIIRVKNTLEMQEIEISVALLQEAKANANMEVVSNPYDFTFNSEDNLF